MFVFLLFERGTFVRKRSMFNNLVHNYTLTFSSSILIFSSPYNLYHLLVPLIRFDHGLKRLQTIGRGQTGSNFGASVFNTIRYIFAHSSTSEYLPDLVASLHTSPTHDPPANEPLLETGEPMGCSPFSARYRVSEELGRFEVDSSDDGERQG